MIRIFSDPVCLEHRGPPGYPECPERLAAILDHLDPGWRHAGRAAPEGVEEAVAAVHDAAYLRRFEHAVARGDLLLDSADNPLAAGSWRAAWAAAATAVAALDWSCGGSGRRAFAVVRPPGHHAERDRAMGFCFLNNAAVMAERARRHHGVGRVAIVDFDVHHGNGTQHAFEERDDVLYVSLHQYPFYPGTGARDEKGRGRGAGYTLNLPLPAGSGDAAYRTVFEESVLPAVRAFAPELLLLSTGFDAWRGDPLGGMRVSVEGFTEWSSLLAELAAEVTGGRLVSLLEGGYDVAALPTLAAAHVKGLTVAGV